MFGKNEVLFRRLRWRLALINLIVMALLLTVLGISTYQLAGKFDQERREHMLVGVGEEVLAGRLADVPANRPPFAPDISFLRVGSDGRIVMASANIPFLPDEWTEITRQVGEKGQADILTYRNQEYFVRKVEAPGTGDGVLVFDRLHHRGVPAPPHGGLQPESLMMALILAVVFCMALSFGASLYLADRALQPIGQGWRLQRDFIANASHELRTPLAIISTNLAALRGSIGDEPDPVQCLWLDNVESEVRQMSRLVNELLFLAKTDAEQVFSRKEIIHLSHLVAEITNGFMPLAAGQSVHLEAKLSEGLFGWGDAGQIRQVVAALVDNALRHTLPGGCVKVTLVENSGRMLLTVKDSGEGIAPEHLPRIFERFYQGDSSRQKGGAGLGLSIARWIVEEHGGVISVNSQLGEGATFVVDLPTAKMGNRRCAKG